MGGGGDSNCAVVGCAPGGPALGAGGTGLAGVAAVGGGGEPAGAGSAGGGGGAGADGLVSGASCATAAVGEPKKDQPPAIATAIAFVNVFMIPLGG